MAAPMFFQLLGHVFLAAHTLALDEEARASIVRSGLDEAQLAKGEALSTLGEELLQRKTLESPDDKTLEHNIHSAVNEVEMWLQTVKFRLRKASVPGELTRAALEHHLHAEKHTVTAIVHALRALGILRVLPQDVREKLGPDQSVHDLITRGNTVVKKSYRVANPFISPSSLSPASMPIFQEVDAFLAGSQAWLERLEAAAQHLAASASDEELLQLGKIGVLPFGVGLPVGGTSFGVVVHQRAKQGAPDPHKARTTSGWSVGRQGNNENLGAGYVKPRYE
ncbi:MAG: hypothetical protein AAGI01_06300 [Myxococcota bacterium]